MRTVGETSILPLACTAKYGKTHERFCCKRNKLLSSKTADVIDIVATVLDIDEKILTIDSNSENVANWDSMLQINIIMSIEEAFGMRFGDEEALNATSIRALCGAVES